MLSTTSWKIASSLCRMLTTVGVRTFSSSLALQTKANLSHMFANPRITLSRLVMPADTQPLGMVHGGVLLSLMEEAGELHATRYCSLCDTPTDKGQVRQHLAALAYVEKTDFISPVKLGEFMQVETQIIYTSSRSLRVLVSVYVSSVKDRRLATKSIFWYVPVDKNNLMTKLHVPVLPNLSPQLLSEGQQAYVKLQSLRRSTSSESLFVSCNELIGDSDYVIQPVHCGQHSICKGGPVMKWIDESAGTAAVRHCRVPFVTASIDNMRFYSSVPVGGFLTVMSRPVFSSSRTVDVYSVAYQQRFDIGKGESVVYEKVADAFLTFAAYRKNASESFSIPSVVPLSQEDKQMYESRKKLYDERKFRKLD